MIAATAVLVLLAIVLLARRAPTFIDGSVTPSLYEWAHSNGGRWRFFLTVTHIGEALITTIIYLALVAVALIRRKLVVAAWVLVTAAIYPSLSWVVKFLVNRQRPVTADPALTFQQTSFPSGHSGSSMTVALTVYFVLAMSTHGWRRVAIGVVAFAVPALVGFSRMALGVHYPTDVLAGFCLSIAWAALTAFIVGKIAARATEAKAIR